MKPDIGSCLVFDVMTNSNVVNIRVPPIDVTSRVRALASRVVTGLEVEAVARIFVGVEIRAIGGIVQR
jgi:hypothetical protein